jgi:hypothetical protein
MRIVRPSGVWNSRAPLHNFFSHALQIQQHYGLLTCAVARTRYDADHLPADGPMGALRFMRSKIAGKAASKAWMAYRDSWRRLNGKYDDQPTIADVETDLAKTLYTIREATVVRYSAMYESYVQAWALNMFLGLQETGQQLSKAQGNLAERFSPVGKQFVIIPGVPDIMKAFPSDVAALALLPHISTNPSTGESVEAPAVPELNALRTIAFWRDFRNHIVHRGSRASPGFCRSHSAFFDLLRVPYGAALRALVPGQQFQLPDLLYYAIATTHNKAAIILNQRLADVSQGLRGRIYRPSSGTPEPTRFDPTIVVEPLLTPGDHPESLAFVDQFVNVPERDED